MDADIAFEDEAGVGVMTRHGKTWGLRGKTSYKSEHVARWI
jgi:hypothetical protein